MEYNFQMQLQIEKIPFALAEARATESFSTGRKIVLQTGPKRLRIAACTFDLRLCL
jgi:hypothetical protein